MAHGSVLPTRCAISLCRWHAREVSFYENHSRPPPGAGRPAPLHRTTALRSALQRRGDRSIGFMRTVAHSGLPQRCQAARSCRT
eukprot:3104633-Prymnesium_polylepis.1